MIGATDDRHLWWRPDLDPADPERWLVAGPGAWGLGTRDAPPSSWHPFPPGTGPLFAFGDTTSYEADEVDRTVATPDPVRFLETYGRAFWCPDDETPTPASGPTTRAWPPSSGPCSATPSRACRSTGSRRGSGRARGASVRLELRYGDGRGGPTGVVAVPDTGVRKAFTFYELAS